MGFCPARNRGGLPFPLPGFADFGAIHPSSWPERTFGWLSGCGVKNSDPCGSRADACAQTSSDFAPRSDQWSGHSYGFGAPPCGPFGRASRGFPPKQASSVHLAESSLRCASVHSRSAELSVLRGDDSLSTARDGVFFICGAAAVSMTEPEGSLARSKVSCWSWGRPKFATPKIAKGAPLTLRRREAQIESLSFGFD